MNDGMIDFDRARELTLASIEPLPCESVPLLALVGRVTATDVIALVDAPSTDISLKDGYAVHATDVAAAAGDHPLPLKLIGSAAAGRPFVGELPPGCTVRVLSGASLPYGADAVLAEEYARHEGDTVLALADARPGRNILPRGTDISTGQQILAAGTVIRPAQVGLLAAAGHARLDVVRQPQVGLIAIGDELAAPGVELAEGMVYASNLATMAAWCTEFGMQIEVALVGDDPETIEQHLVAAQATCDAIITMGGAWRGERDFITATLDRLGWRKLYRHVKLGPGKAVSCGLWDGKPVFSLPGGPPSSQVAFLQLALPALLKLAGRRHPHLPWLMAELSEDVAAQADWTQVIEGRVAATATGMQFHPRKLASRLQSMADAEGLVMIPTGTSVIPRGTIVPVQILPNALPTGPWPTALAADSPRTDVAPRARPPVVSFVAVSKTGKTTFLEQLIPELAALGLRVGVLKHHSHATPFDVPGKDTYRLAQAGASVVVGACSVQVAVFRQEDGTANLEMVIARDLADTDLVLIEGFKRGPYPKIEIHRSAHSRELLCTSSELLALVTDEPLDVDVPQFALTDVGGVAAFLHDWALGADEPVQGSSDARRLHQRRAADRDAPQPAGRAGVTRP